MTYEWETVPESLQGWARQFTRVQFSYANPIDQRRAQGLLRVMLFSLIMYCANMVFLILPAVIDSGEVTIATVFVVFAPPILMALVTYWIQSGQLQRAAVLVVLGSVPLVISIIQANGIASPALTVIVVPLVFVSLLMDRRWLSLVSAFILLSLMLVAISEDGSLAPLVSDSVIGPLTTIALLVGVIFVLSGHEHEIITHNLQAVANMGKVMGFVQRDDLKTETSIYVAAIDLIRDELDYDFAQIFLTDSQGSIRNRLRTGLSVGQGEEVSSIQMNVTHGPVNAILARRPITITLEDEASRRSHFLASTRFSYLIPVIYDDEVFAVVDVHSTDAPFDDSDLKTFANLVQNMAARVHELRYTNALATQLEEYRAANTYLRSQLADVRRSSSDLIGSSWQEYLSGRGGDAIGFNISDETHELVNVDDLPEHIQVAMRAKKVVVQDVDALPTLIVPVILQDEVLGAMAFSLPKDQKVTQDQLDIAQNIARRLALALENRRLFEQSRAQALRERTANEVAGQLITATDVESVLSLAANRFHEALGAVHTQIRLQPETASSRQGENGTAS